MYNRSQTGQSISEFMKITEDDEDARDSLPTESGTASTSGAAAAVTSATTESTTSVAASTSASARNNDDSLTNEIKSLDVSKAAGTGAGGAQSSAAAAPVKFRIDDDFLFQMEGGILWRLINN